MQIKKEYMIMKRTLWFIFFLLNSLLEGYCKLFIPCGGADDPRPIKLRRKGNGQWFLWEQYLMTGIRIPTSADPWA